MDDLPPTEAQNPSTADLDSLDTLALLHRINDEDRRAAAAVERELDSLAAAVDAVVDRMKRGGALHYFGSGTSGRLGLLDAAEIPPTFSVDPRMVVGHIAGGLTALTRAVEEAEDDADAGRAEVTTSDIGAGDIVVGLSASGTAAYVVAALKEASRMGALTICITNSPGSAVSDQAAISVVLRTGPEAIAGSTRMKAAVAQKMAITALSTAVMVKLGKVHGNLMVDVAPTNRKLRDRALRLVQQITGAREDEARDALVRCGYRVKVAALVVAHGCSVDAAESMLSAAGGSLRGALGDKNREARR